MGMEAGSPFHEAEFNRQLGTLAVKVARNNEQGHDCPVVLHAVAVMAERAAFGNADDIKMRIQQRKRRKEWDDYDK